MSVQAVGVQAAVVKALRCALQVLKEAYNASFNLLVLDYKAYESSCFISAEFRVFPVG